MEKQFQMQVSVMTKICMNNDETASFTQRHTGRGVSLGSQRLRRTWTSVCNLNQLDAAGFVKTTKMV